MRASRTAVAWLFLATIVSGCAASEAGTSGASGPGSFAPDADGGHVQGTVTDDALSPLAGAQVAVPSQPGLVAVTDAGGAFLLTGVPPGVQTVFAIALGYESAARTVNVAAGEVVTVSFLLEPIPIVVPYTEAFGPFQGYFECRMARAGTTGECGWLGGGFAHPTELYPNDRSIFRFNISNEETYRSFVGDIQWTPGSAATGTEMRLAFSYEKRDSSHWFCSAEGNSPLQWRWEYPNVDESTCASVGGTDEPDRPYLKDNPMRTYANVPFGSGTNQVRLSLQQRFEVMVHVFYGEPAPPEFNGFPDA